MRSECGNKINQVFFISTAWELSVNRIAPNLAGLPWATKDLDPLIVLQFDNQIYISTVDLLGLFTGKSTK